MKIILVLDLSTRWTLIHLKKAPVVRDSHRLKVDVKGYAMVDRLMLNLFDRVAQMSVVNLKLLYLETQTGSDYI